MEGNGYGLWGFFSGLYKVLTLVVVIDAQLCEYNKNHCIVQVNYMVCELCFNKTRKIGREREGRKEERKDGRGNI